MKFFTNTEITSTAWVATALARQTHALVPDQARGAGYKCYADTCNFVTVCVGEWMGMGGTRMDAWSESSPTLFKTRIEAEQMAAALRGDAFEFSLIPDTIRIYKVVRHSVVDFDVQEQTNA